ncbi:MAG: hypothetical protein ACYS8W_12565 [Planctomycetota bacterium]|jgi:hypothetical protein
MKYRTISALYICATACLVFSGGCSTIPLDAAIVEPASARVALEIGVGPFEDARKEWKNEGKFCFVVPLFPYGWYFYESPDRTGVAGIGSIAFSPMRESQDVFLDALKKSKIFGKVHLINDWDKDEVGDIEVRGKVVMASCSEKFWTYGLSMAGAVFWLFGAPLFTSSETYAVEIELRWRGEAVPIWSYRGEKEISVVRGLYYRSNEFDKPKHASKYRSLRRYIVEVLAVEFIRELDRKLGEKPNLLSPRAAAPPEEPVEKEKVEKGE